MRAVLLSNVFAINWQSFGLEPELLGKHSYIILYVYNSRVLGLPTLSLGA